MGRSKKFIILAVLAATILLAGSMGAVAFANRENGDDSPEARYQALLDRVCEIYQEKTGVTIDQEALKDAFDQARSEMQSEALDEYLQSLVDEGKITQEQADQYLQWWESRPDVPVVPGLGGRGMPRAFGGPGGGFPGWFRPPPSE